MDTNSTQQLSDVYTVEEAAKELGVEPGSIYRMLTEKKLRARKATLEEQAILEKQQRITGSSGRGRNLISAASVKAAKSRPAPGWPRKKDNT